MRAVIIDNPGTTSELRVAEVPSPVCGPTEVRIQVAGAGINRADLLQRKGLYPPPLGASDILGLECSGTIVEVGSAVTDFREGDLVMALLTGGGYAEQVVTPAETVMRVPKAISNVDAGGVPEVFLTAFLNLFMLGGLEEDHFALVHGGSGGVGTAAIQLIRSAGAEALVTAGSDERCDRCRLLGAEHAFNYRHAGWVPDALHATDGHGADVILDCVGAPYLGHHLEVLSIGGRLVVIGLQGGREAALDLSVVMRKRLTIIGSTLRARPAAEKGRIITAFVHQFGRELENGAIRPIIDRVLPFDRAAEAHGLLAGGEIFGKIILTPTTDV
jgi:putative PIG3 family NAD(P)H quinone oxidoreductase